ncbi:MAG: DUF362 domain-containing protein [Candidatus Lokiarchaeota archaeon]|nr:DUF362 domain-containing protein [Candidatus Lokiarchaeota archaeon]MBD3199509.1 DUF362 domain-containing protein [Candidatus Lokiarchaeota archaeon]
MISKDSKIFLFILFLYTLMSKSEKTKIAIQKIQHDDIHTAVFKALELIHAKNLFKKPNLSVLLKPNILMSKEPEGAVVTHPEIVRTVIQWVKQFEPKKIIIAESSGTTNRGATERAFIGSGIKSVAEDEEVEWIPFDQTNRKIYQVKDPLILDKIASSQLIEEVDIIINIPKLKTHSQCILTCSIKNMFGTLILGNKPKTHAKFPKYEDFSAALADIYSISKPQLTVVDGYLCQEGNGPTRGDVVKMDLILTGYDPVALDTVACEIIGFNPEEVLYINKAAEKGLGTKNLDKIEILGENIKDVYRKFERPKIKPISVPLPRWLADYVGDVIFRASIKFNPSKCKLCSTCWENCPVNAISPPEILRKGNIPIWDKNKCIFCYCCAELCPHEAVDFRINYIRNFFTSKLGIIFSAFIITIVVILILILL